MVMKRYEMKKKEWKWNDKWIDNEIGDERARSISESLKINTSLTELLLNCEEKIGNEKKSRKR